MKDNPTDRAESASILVAIVRSRAFIAAAIALALYALCGFFLAPYLVGYYVPKAVREDLGMRADIGAVRINPFIFTLTAEDFRLSDDSGEPMLGFDRLLVDFELSSLFRWAWTLRTIALDSPAVHLVMDTDGRLNLEQLIPAGADPQASPKPSSPLRMVVQNLTVRDGEIDIIDRRQSTPATIRIRPLDLEIGEIATLPERKGQYTLAFTTLAGAKVKWAGDMSLRPLRSMGRLELSDFNVASLWEFVRDDNNLAPPGGHFAVTTAYAVDLSGADPRLTLDELAMRLEDLVLQLNGEKDPLLRLDRLTMESGRFDLASRRLNFEAARMEGGHARVDIDADGRLNFNRIVRVEEEGNQSFKKDQPARQNESAATDPPWQLGVEAFRLENLSLIYADNLRKPALRGRIGNIDLNFGFTAAVGTPTADARIEALTAGLTEMTAGLSGDDATIVRIDRLALEGGSFALAPRRMAIERIGVTGGHADVVRLTDGSVNLQQLLAAPERGAIKREVDEVRQSAEPFRFEVTQIDVTEYTAAISDHTVKQDGSILDLDPFSLEISDFDGRSPFDFKMRIPVRQGGVMDAAGRIDPKKPTVSADLRIRNLALPVLQPYIEPVANLELSSGKLTTSGRLQYDSRLTFDGGVHLVRLLIQETIAAKPLLSWKVLDAPHVKLQTDPNRLEIAEVKLVEPFNELIINADGSINLVKVFKRNPAAATAGKRTASNREPAAFSLRLDRVGVSKGKLNFADLSLTPQFAALIHDLDGAVVGISTGRDDRARIELDGQVDEFGSAKIGGEINAFDPTTLTDVTMVFSNLKMSSFTPYSAKFAGRRIRSGKLNLNLEYKIENRRLLGDNQIVVDRLELGETVESPEAVSLPLDLAVALLEDSRGVIDIGLPVKGDLDNPEFSIGHLIWKALLNLLTKIVTSPFNALASLVGADVENMDAVAFEPGRAQVPPPEREKLKVLSDALEQRPHLAVLVQGRYDPQADGVYLKSLQLRRLLAEQSDRKLSPTEDPGPVDFDNPAIRKLLASMYAERFGEAQLTEKMQPPETGSGTQAAAGQGEQTPADPSQPYKALFRELAAVETLPAGILPQLADDRAAAVMAELTAVRGVAASRVATLPPEPQSGAGAAVASLTLEVNK